MCYTISMKIAILGYGKEGQSAEKYFKNQTAEITVFDNFTTDALQGQDFSSYDLVFRSPSVPPLESTWTSVTKYFFDHCPCKIIGVTGTKGKGTTSSLITAILTALGYKVWLVGNIGNPALDILDEVQPNDIVVYEMSSFQLWDLEKSPHVAVVLGIEPDHLNVHRDYDDYVAAKANIATHQTTTDYCVYNQTNSDAKAIGEQSAGKHLPYPITTDRTALDRVLDQLSIPGQHNRDNAEAALFATSAYLDKDLNSLLIEQTAVIETALHNFQGLPHRLEFLRELNGVRYYDDNFSSALPSLDVALSTFTKQPLFLIAGGFDRGIDQAPTQRRIFSAPNLKKVFLIGQTSGKIAAGQDQNRYQLCSNLEDAFNAARHAAESAAAASGKPVVLLMSPGAPSFDMFQNFVERGQIFQKLVQEA